MRKLHTNKKRLVPLILCSVLVLQQSLMSQSMAASVVTDANGNTIGLTDGQYELRPDGIYKGGTNIGFRQFKDLKLDQGEVMNFIFQALQQKNGANGEQIHEFYDVKTFVNLIQNQAEIRGIVNAVSSYGGGLSDGNLVFISPNGLVVGSSGVLNVGSLQVYTPSTADFERMRTGLPTGPAGVHPSVQTAQDVTNTFNPNDPSLLTGSGTIKVDGRILARGDVELHGGNVGIGNGGLLLAGVGGNTEVFDGTGAESAANTLFTSLVNTDNMNTGSGFANTNGKIVITSNVGTSVDAGAKVRNYAANSQTSITNTGANGINISGEVSNANGTLIATNTNGALNINNGALVKNKGTMTIIGKENNTGTNINGEVINYGDMTITNEKGTNGLNIGGEVTNNTGRANITNNEGGLNVTTGGSVTSNGTELLMTNFGEDGFTIDGIVTSNAGNATLTNETNVFDINTAGNVTSNGDNLNVINRGVNGLNIAGSVNNNTGKGLITNKKGGLNVKTGGAVTSDGTSLTMTNNGDNGFVIDGTVTNNSGTALLENDNNMFDINGTVTANGTSVDINNSGSNGLNITGNVNNNNGTAHIANTAGALTVSPTGKVNSKGTELLVSNTGTGGMHIQGIVNHANKNGTVHFVNKNSNMVVGHTTTDFNINSDADVNIDVTNGNLYNYGVAKTHIKTTDGANLNIAVSNGAIGKEVGPCIDGVCTGIGGEDARDLTKSINTSIDGVITASSTGNGALVNMASLDKDMHINQITSDGRVILLADDKTNKGATPYNILNKAVNQNKPNIKGNGISVIASGNIGEKGNKVTFIQTNADFNDASWNNDKFNYTPNAERGVDMLAIGDINVKGLDNEDGTKNDTNVCAMISREGSIDAEFSGDTYIGEITAKDRIDIVNRGKNMYIEHLGEAPTYYPELGDYYGNKDNVVPNRVHISVLDLGTVENPNTAADSTLIIKNGQINGDGLGRPSKDQDLTITVDNGYVGGYHFNMGKDRMPGHSTVTVDNRTNKLTNPDGTTEVSIRGEAVRPYDVTDIGRDDSERNYYYGSDEGMPDEDKNGTGSEQGGDPDYDGTDNPGGTDDDNLVVPTPPDEPDPPPGDDDDDDDGPNPPPGDDDDDDDGPNPPPGDDDDDDDGPNPPPPGDDDDEPTMDDAKQTWKKEYNDYISVIDKRQYMRFDINGNPNPVVFESTPEVNGILNISRGGVQLTHNKSLKVGDVIPVHVKYGDVEVNANVKIVSASEATAGGEFVDLDLATANKILYLSLLMDDADKPQDQYYANTNYNSISSTGEDE